MNQLDIHREEILRLMDALLSGMRNHCTLNNMIKHLLQD